MDNRNRWAIAPFVIPSLRSKPRNSQENRKEEEK